MYLIMTKRKYQAIAEEVERFDTEAEAQEALDEYRWAHHDWWLWIEEEYNDD